MVKTNRVMYKKEIVKEAKAWEKVAVSELANHPPDYSYYKKTLPYKIYRNIYVRKALSYVNPNDQVLDLGCYNGWFTLEMARKGARIDAHDVAGKTINIARQHYKKVKGQEKFSGTILYYVTDLNFPKFPQNKYDLVVIRNVLHHLINLKILYKKIYKSLKPRGLILIDDALSCGGKEAFFSGILLALLPTDIPYSQKFSRIFKKGLVLKRTQDMIDAKGTSPFEGVSSGDENIQLLKKFFVPIEYKTFSAFIGVISSHLRLPEKFKLYILKALNLLDIYLIKIGILKGTNFYLVAKKQ